MFLGVFPESTQNSPHTIRALIPRAINERARNADAS